MKREENKKDLNAEKDDVNRLPDRTQNTFASDSNPENHIMDEYDFIYGLIPTGQKKAISMNELSVSTMNNQRLLRRKIADMRACGYLVCGDSHGYYRPASTGELEAWYRQARARARTTIKGLQKAEETLNSHALPKGRKGENDLL